MRAADTHALRVAASGLAAVVVLACLAYYLVAGHVDALCAMLLPAVR